MQNERPALYAEIDRLRAENEQLKRQCDGERRQLADMWRVNKGMEETLRQQLADGTAALKEADSQLTEQTKLLADAEGKLRLMTVGYEAKKAMNTNLIEQLKDMSSYPSRLRVAEQKLAEAKLAMADSCGTLVLTEKRLAQAQAKADKATAEAAELRCALVAEEEAVTAARRYYQVFDLGLRNPGEPDPNKWGTRYRADELRYKTLASTTLAADHMARLERMEKALVDIRDYEYAHGFYSEALSDVKATAREALARKEGENG